MADYQGDDRFMTRIGVGGLINLEKIQQAHTVLNDVHVFQQHAQNRLKKQLTPDVSDSTRYCCRWFFLLMTLLKFSLVLINDLHVASLMFVAPMTSKRQ